MNHSPSAIEVAMSPTGPPHRRHPGRDSGGDQSAPPHCDGGHPVGGLPAGDFVIRALVRTGSNSAIVSRTLRKALQNHP